MGTKQIIDLKRIKDALPNRAEVAITRYNGSQEGLGSRCIKVFIPEPSLDENDFKQCLQWQREILGDTLNEFYTEETGRLWYAYLKFNNKPISIEI